MADPVANRQTRDRFIVNSASGGSGTAPPHHVLLVKGAARGRRAGTAQD